MVDVMNTELGQLLKRVKVLKDAIAWIKAIDTKEKQLIIKAIHEQLQGSIDEDGKELFSRKTQRGYYSEMTEQITRGKKKAGDPYNLEDTGDFYRSMFVEVALDSFQIDGNAQKSPKDNLFVDFGDGIVGLTPLNLDKLVKRLTIKYIEYVREILQIN